MSATTVRPATDSWSLRVMREAKAYRDANPGQTDAERAEDAFLDAYLQLCEDAAAEAGVTPAAREQATAEAQEAAARRQPGRPSTGASNYTQQATGGSPAQLAYIAKLAAALGRELDTPRDRAHASRIIDAAKRELATRPAADRAPRPATEGQRSYLADLLATRAHDHGELDLDAVTFAQASAMIDTLSRAPRATAPEHGIREGRYAYQPVDGPASFYRVSRTGRIYIQAGPAEHPYRGRLNAALEWIKANPRDAAALYGQLLEHCGRCGRELTDEDSRARGLGPDCARKTDW